MEDIKFKSKLKSKSDRLVHKVVPNTVEDASEDVKEYLIGDLIGPYWSKLEGTILAKAIISMALWKVISGILLLSFLFCIFWNVCCPTRLDDGTEAQRFADGKETGCPRPEDERQIGNYDAGEWTGITQLLMINAYGSIFRSSRVIRQVCFAFLLTICIFFITASMRIDRQFVKDFKRVNDYLMTFLPFFFAMYLNTIIGRWWAMRTCGIGALTSTIMDMYNLLAVCSKGSSAVDEHHPAQVALRYGLLSFDISWITNGGRPFDIDELIHKGYLLENERSLIEKCKAENSNPAQAIWAWILSLVMIMVDKKQLEKVHLKRTLRLVDNGKAATRCIATYTSCQIPMAWVHLMTTAVNICTLTLCGQTALEMVAIIADPEAKFLTCRGSSCHLGTLLPRMCLALVYVIVLPCVYYGFLDLGCSLMNPLGLDTSDFPRMRYLKGMMKEANGIKMLATELPPVITAMKKAGSRKERKVDAGLSEGSHFDQQSDSDGED
jgi:hypothetical protein